MLPDQTGEEYKQLPCVVKCRFVGSPMKDPIDSQGVIETWKVP